MTKQIVQKRKDYFYSNKNKKYPWQSIEIVSGLIGFIVLVLNFYGIFSMTSEQINMLSAGVIGLIVAIRGIKTNQKIDWSFIPLIFSSFKKSK